MTRGPRIGRFALLGGAVATVAFLMQGGRSDAQEHQHESLFDQIGSDIIPLRQVSDPYPVFNGIALDPVNNVVAMSDVNRKSLLSYERAAGANAGEITDPRHQIFGPLTNVGFVAGIALDPDRKEILAVNNDIEDTLIVL